MLITFRISNFLSFDETVEFSMRKGDAQKLESHVIEKKNRNDVSVLKSAMIYGANASGKSNFIKAIAFAQTLITKGFEQVSTDRKHFRLAKENIHKNTEIEFEFKYKGKMYAYGVVLSLKERKIREEWLFELTATTDKPIFERKVLENEKSEINFGVDFGKKGNVRFEVYKEDIKDAQLFLSEINDKNIDGIDNIYLFKDAYEWMTEKIIIIQTNTKYTGLDFVGSSYESKNVFHSFLEMFRTGINGIETIEKDIEDEISPTLKEEIFEDLQKMSNHNVIGMTINRGDQVYSFSKNQNGEIKLLRLNTQHRLINSEELTNFELSEESDGTQRIMDFIPVLIGLTKDKSTYFIDEIDRSLHPELSRKIIEVFLSNSKNIETQLIATTHESSLLDLELLRRDEIWFVEKNQGGASKMYSLEQFKPRYDAKIRKSYLEGRFGAIPFVPSVENLEWLKSEN